MEDSNEEDLQFMKEDDWEDEDEEDILWFTQQMKDIEARKVPDKRAETSSTTQPALTDSQEDRSVDEAA